MSSVLELKLLDALDEGVVLVDQGSVHYVNRAAAMFLDTPAGARPPTPLIHVLRDHRLERAFFEQETLELFTRGRTLLARPAPDALFLKDVSDAKRAQNGARELLAVLSHELRTPVTAISSALEALRYDMSEAQRARFLDLAETESRRLVRLLEDLTVDVKPPMFRRIELKGLAERAEHLVGETLKEHAICLKTDLPDATVWADSDKLLQVLINLLENAALHGPDQGRVALAATFSDEQPGFLEVTVRDEGSPLEPSLIETLFEPHTRGDAGKVKGTGLGLYVVRSIVRTWGGEAWGKPLANGNEFGFTVGLKQG